jgi:hypothetical protein
MKRTLGFVEERLPKAFTLPLIPRSSFLKVRFRLRSNVNWKGHSFLRISATTSVESRPLYPSDS